VSRAVFVGFACAALVACGGSDDAVQKKAPGPPCVADGDCADGEVCAVARVRELSLEPDDDARCIAASDAIGSAPPTWTFVAGGAALADRLCLAGGLNRGAGAESDAIRARQVELIGAAGVRLMRLDFTWSVIEPAKGALDFSQFDPMVDAASAAGLEVLGIVAYGTPWASSLTSSDDRYPPDDAADYASFARALAEHYQGKVRRWELWNEPNGGWRFFRPDLNGDAAKYGAMMVAAARSIHEACSDCTVYSAGLFFHTQVVNGALEFSHDMLSADASAFDFVDAYGIHPYTLYPPKTRPEDDAPPERALSGMVEDIARVFAEHHAALPPIAATELGWPSYAPVTEPIQASYLAREILLGASLGLDPLCWFTLADGPDHGTFPPEDDFGLYRFGSDDPAGTIDAKPSRDAMAFLAEIGKNAVPAGASPLAGFFDPGAGRFALDFTTAAGTLTALWQTDGAPFALHLDGETRHAVGLDGQALAVPAGGTLDLDVSDALVFLLP
jgi:polysaccharide biosynthesis protein PslG